MSPHEGSNERIGHMRKSSAVMQKEFDKAKLDFPFEGDLLKFKLKKVNGFKLHESHSEVMMALDVLLDTILVHLVLKNIMVLSITTEVIARVVGEVPLRYYIHRS